MRFARPHFKASRGLVVGVSSLAGKTGVPGRTTYCASKFAQTGFLEALRIEAEPLGIAVLAVCPGIVATEIRRRGPNAQGQPAGVSGLEERGAMPVDECARQIAAAMRARQREFVTTTKGKIGLWLKLIAPRLVDNMARAAPAKTTGNTPRQGPSSFGRRTASAPAAPITGPATLVRHREHANRAQLDPVDDRVRKARQPKGPAPRDCRRAQCRVQPQQSNGRVKLGEKFVGQLRAALLRVPSDRFEHLGACRRVVRKDHPARAAANKARASAITRS